MNNRIQQRFDRSISEAVEATQRANDAKPRRRIVVPPSAPEKEPKGRLFLCPETGATVWEPVGTYAQELTDEKILEIRREYTGTTRGQPSNAVELAARYGVTRGTIVQIAKGELWAHVK